MNTKDDSRADRIRALNDALRTTGAGGRIFATRGVMDIGDAFFHAAVQAMRAHDDFSPKNDPHGEHDFGRMVVEGTPVFWKIDYYDQTMEYGSEDPADPDKTTRVLTLFLAQEY